MEPEGSILPSPPVLILAQTKPVHAPPSHFLKIHINTFIPSKPRSSMWSLSLRFTHKEPVCTYLPHMCYMYRPFHSSWLDTWIIFCEYKSQSSRLCSLLQCHGNSSHLGSNNSAPNHIHITSDPGRYNEDFYASSFISETPIVRLSEWSLRRIASCTMGTGSFPRVNAGAAWRRPPTPI